VSGDRTVREVECVGVVCGVGLWIVLSGVVRVCASWVVAGSISVMFLCVYRCDVSGVGLAGLLLGW